MARRAISFEDKAQWMRDRHAPASVSLVTYAPSSFTERHYAVAEIAELWGLSSDAIRKLFEDEPGVLVLGGQVAHKRRYTTLRVPESVLRRVHRRMTNV